MLQTALPTNIAFMQKYSLQDAPIKTELIAVCISQEVDVDITWDEKLCRGTASAIRIDKEIFGKNGC